MGKVKDQNALVEAKANIKKTWEDLFNLVEVQNRDAPLVSDYLKNKLGYVIKDSN